MAAAPETDTPAAQDRRWIRLAHVVRQHPVMAVVSVLGTIATFVVGTARVTGLVLGGTLGGGIGDEIPIDSSGLPSAPGYEYVSVSDDTGQISVEVPTSWADVPGDGWYTRSIRGVADNTRVGPGLNAAPNVNAWKEDLTTPGVFIGASRELLEEHSPTTILRRQPPDGCFSTSSETYANDRFTGEIVTFRCPDAGAEWRRLAATPTTTREYLVYLEAKLRTTADVEAYNVILNTFELDFRG